MSPSFLTIFKKKQFLKENILFGLLGMKTESLQLLEGGTGVEVFFPFFLWYPIKFAPLPKRGSLTRFFSDFS